MCIRDSGGTTWRDLSDAVDERPSSNSTMVGEFLDSGSAWLSVREQDGGALLLRSHDGGTTWQRTASPFRFVGAPPASFLLDLPAAIAFSDDARGVVLVQSYRADGDESFVLRTSNGGGSWERAALPADVLPIGLDTLP